MAWSTFIAHTIKNALSSDIFSEVIVSSEDDEILNCAKNYGAKTVTRKKFPISRYFDGGRGLHRCH